MYTDFMVGCAASSQNMRLQPWSIRSRRYRRTSLAQEGSYLNECSGYPKRIQGQLRRQNHPKAV